MPPLRLLDPSPAALREALSAAASEVYHDAGEAAWADLEPRLGEPEGVFRYAPMHPGLYYHPPGLLAVWWEDALGRRAWHVGMETPLEMPFRPEPPADRPPLAWFAPPGACGWLTRGGHTEIVTACRCGLVRPPRSIAWMGACCGPCHDREQEGATPLGHPPLRFPAPVEACLVAPDGRLVVIDALRGAKPHFSVEAWAPPYDGRPLWRRDWPASGNWAAACGPRHVAVFAASKLWTYRLDDGTQADSRPTPELAGNVELCIAGEGGDRLIGLTRWDVRGWELRGDGRIGPLRFEAPFPAHVPVGMRPLPGGRVLMPDLSVRDAGLGGLIGDRAGPPLAHAVGPGGEVFAVVDLNGARRVARWDGPPDGRRPAAVIDAPDAAGLAASPDGACLAWAARGGVRLCDARTLRELAFFRPADAGGMSVLALTPSGELLASTRDGVAGYPWRELAGLG